MYIGGSGEEERKSMRQTLSRPQAGMLLKDSASERPLPSPPCPRPPRSSCKLMVEGAGCSTGVRGKRDRRPCRLQWGEHFPPQRRWSGGGDGNAQLGKEARESMSGHSATGTGLSCCSLVSPGIPAWVQISLCAAGGIWKKVSHGWPKPTD